MTGKRERFQLLLGETRQRLHAALAKSTATGPETNGANIIAAIGAFDGASKNVFANSYLGNRKVVSGGWTISLISMSSNPIIDTSSGMENPIFIAARIAPIAVKSFAVKTAVGLSSSESNSVIAAAPPVMR